MGGKALSQLRISWTAVLYQLSERFPAEQRAGFARILLVYLIGAVLLLSAHWFLPEAKHPVIFVMFFAIAFYQPYIMYRYGFLRKGSRGYIYHRFMFGLFILIGTFTVAMTVYVIFTVVMKG